MLIIGFKQRVEENNNMKIITQVAVGFHHLLVLSPDLSDLLRLLSSASYRFERFQRLSNA